MVSVALQDSISRQIGLNNVSEGKRGGRRSGCLGCGKIARHAKGKKEREGEKARDMESLMEYVLDPVPPPLTLGKIFHRDSSVLSYLYFSCFSTASWSSSCSSSPTNRGSMGRSEKMLTITRWLHSTLSHLPGWIQDERTGLSQISFILSSPSFNRWFVFM